MPFDYSITIPAYNEAAFLREAVSRLLSFLHTRPESVEIILVENGSTDETWREALALAALYPEVRALRSLKGKGAAILAGWQAAEAPIVLFIDADLSPSLQTLPTVYQAIRASGGVALADRFLKTSSVNRRLGRRLLSRLWSWLAFVVLPLPYMDFQCGLKGCSRAFVREIARFTPSREWFFDVEFLLCACQRGLAITRVPVVWTERVFVGRNSHLPIVRTAWKFIRSLAQLGWRLRSHRTSRAQSRARQ